ncbi:MAG TPA: hypothetical protein VD970_08930, partial [Acetobacteraceae bacterium]|nr:hypothetical protein [Acetobacteraceae bacterium]
EGIGSFGFLCLDRDAAVLEALLGAARNWLAARGARRIRGPMSFTINHEIGALVAGFEAPGSPRMPRTPAWLPAMLERAGLEREMDVHACVLRVAEERHRARFARVWRSSGVARGDAPPPQPSPVSTGEGDSPSPASEAQRGRAGVGARKPAHPALRIRPADPARWPEEVALLTDLFNDAWAENWGFVPVTPDESNTIARVMRPIVRAGAILFAEWRGEAIGTLVLLPNIEEAWEQGGGRLLPLGWWRLLRALRPGGVASARVPMLGIRRAYRGTRISALATGALLDAAITEAEQRGWEQVEISWILATNAAMLNTMAALPAPVERTWRIYGAAIERWF